MLLHLFLQSSYVIPGLDAVIFESLATDESYATGHTSCPPHCNSPIILFFFSFVERVCLRRLVGIGLQEMPGFHLRVNSVWITSSNLLCICVRTWLWALHIFSHFTLLVLCSFLKRSSRGDIYIPLWLVIVTSAGGSPSAIMHLVSKVQHPPLSVLYCLFIP